jgi:hypothetical protein
MSFLSRSIQAERDAPEPLSMLNEQWINPWHGAPVAHETERVAGLANTANDFGKPGMKRGFTPGEAEVIDAARSALAYYFVENLQGKFAGRRVTFVKTVSAT